MDLARSAQGISEGIGQMVPAVQAIAEQVQEIRQARSAILSGTYWGALHGTNGTNTTFTAGTIAYAQSTGGYVTYTGGAPQTWTTTTFPADLTPRLNTPRAEYRELLDDQEPRELTEEDRAAREQVRVEHERRTAEMHRVRAEREAELWARVEAANERARDLLRSVVTDEQWQEFERDNSITVRGSAGGLYSVVCSGTNGNVRYLSEGGEVLGTLCAHPHDYTDEGDIPTTDLHAGQVLALATDEQAWLSKANVHWGVMPPHYVPAAPPFPGRVRDAF